MFAQLSDLENERNDIGGLLICHVDNVLSIVVFYFWNVMLNNLSLFYIEIDVFSYLSCEILVFIVCVCVCV